MPNNINKSGIRISKKKKKKMPQKELRNPKKHNNEKSLAYVATYNKTTQNYSQK